MLKPVEKQRVAEDVAAQLRALILTGQYPPGSKLPPERELSRRLRVNRASLREALKKLEHLGLVRIRQGDGTRVQDFMASGGIELVPHLLPLASLRPALIRDLLELRRWFGRELARLAASRARQLGTGALRALADRADQASSASELVELDFEFYAALAHLAGNQAMSLLLNTLRDGVRDETATLASLVGPRELVCRHHRELIAALDRGDAAVAARVADDYLRLAAEGAPSSAPISAPLPAPVSAAVSLEAD